MKHISELQQGDELICYMRLGLALEMAVKGNGTPFRRVPKRTKRAKAADLTRFTGIVLKNNVAAGVLTMSTTRMDHRKFAVNSVREQKLPADIHYSAFKKVQLVSKYHEEPTEPTVGRPTKRQGRGEARQPYRTLEEIDLR